MPNNSNNPKILKKTIGRRRTATASVYLLAGNAEMTVNGQPISQYFPGVESQILYLKPFTILSLEKYTATIKVAGGGKNGQLDATVLGLSRALAQIKEEYKKKLRDAGLLTRDSRERQRRMVGMGGKSRRKKQSPKR